jgi:PTH1 family peptidyl-tRNA hydrolase
MFRRKVEVQPQFLVFGLGNPGARYAHTRHNLGWWVLDELAVRAGVKRSLSRHRGQADYCVLSGMDAALIKPTTYMNLSGECVAPWLRELREARWCVVCDDISMEVGKARFRRQGSAGGHNGLKSIIECLGYDAFDRIKLGVGAPDPGVDAAEYVLEPPTKAELQLLHAAVKRAADAVLALAAGDDAAVLRALAENDGPRRGKPGAVPEL